MRPLGFLGRGYGYFVLAVWRSCRPRVVSPIAVASRLRLVALLILRLLSSVAHSCRRRLGLYLKLRTAKAVGCRQREPSMPLASLLSRRVATSRGNGCRRSDMPRLTFQSVRCTTRICCQHYHSNSPSRGALLHDFKLQTREVRRSFLCMARAKFFRLAAGYQQQYHVSFYLCAL